MTTEAQRAAMKRYYEKTKKEKKRVLLTFDREKDEDVIRKLESVNRSQYVAKLIRKDINGSWR